MHGRSFAAPLLATVAASWLVSSCATLGELGRIVSAPRFGQAPDRDPELRLLPPAPDSPSGGAAVRLWLTVNNPNPFSITLTRLAGTLSLERSRAATADFPLGLPLRAREETVIPLDLSIDFRDIPGLANALRRAITTGQVAYDLDGTIGVETPIGNPTFGPMPIVSGTLDVTQTRVERQRLSIARLAS